VYDVRLTREKNASNICLEADAFILNLERNK